MIAASLLALALTAAPRTVDRIVARVDSTVITFSRLHARATPLLAQVDATQKEAVLRRSLEDLIEHELILAAARQNQITVDPAEVNRALESVAEANKLSIDEVLTAARLQGYTADEYKNELRRQLMELRWLNLMLAAEPTRDPKTSLAEHMSALRQKHLKKLRAVAHVEVKL